MKQKTLLEIEVCQCGYRNKHKDFKLVCPSCKRTMKWAETPAYEKRPNGDEVPPVSPTGL